MDLYEHDERQCRWCGERLWYGLKEEPTGWKVYYFCRSPDGCSRERMIGRIPRSSVDHIDAVYRKAESMDSFTRSGI
jgi:hypothetical protein